MQPYLCYYSTIHMDNEKHTYVHNLHKQDIQMSIKSTMSSMLALG